MVLEKGFIKNFSMIFLIDSMLFAITFLIANFIRFRWDLPSNYPTLKAAFFFMLFVVLINIISCYFNKVFDNRNRSFVEVFYESVMSIIVASLMMASIAYFDWTFRLPRTIIFMLFALNLPLLTIVNYLLQNNKGKSENVMIIGNGSVAKSMIKKVSSDDSMELIGYSSQKKEKSSIAFLGRLEKISDIVEKYRIDKIIIAIEKKNQEEIMPVLLLCHDLQIPIYAPIETYSNIYSLRPIDETFIEIMVRPENLYARFFKRVTDIFIGFIGTLISIIFYPFIAFLIKIDSKGPVLYIQKRQGWYGGDFIIMKFRTMILNAEKKTGPIISDNKVDSRITKVGWLLRKTHLDELPQFLNILKGEMSFIGPRPERAELSKKFAGKYKDWNKRLFIKPGLTGLAQVEGFDGLDPRNKIKRDLVYLQNMTFLMDLKIFFYTILKILKG